VNFNFILTPVTIWEELGRLVINLSLALVD